jgi:hypothetical protein
MGLGGSKAAEVTIGADNVTVPSWAQNYRGKSSIVFFDMEADGSERRGIPDPDLLILYRKPLGRIEMCLMNDIVPKTYVSFFLLSPLMRSLMVSTFSSADNFRALCTGKDTFF